MLSKKLFYYNTGNPGFCLDSMNACIHAQITDKMIVENILYLIINLINR